MQEDSVKTARPETLEEIERKAVLASLARNAGNRTHAADELGICVRTLQRRLASYQLAGIPVPPPPRPFTPPRPQPEGSPPIADEEVIAAIIRHGGNRRRAADELGLPRGRVYAAAARHVGRVPAAVPGRPRRRHEPDGR